MADIQFRVKVAYQSGETIDYRYAKTVGMNEWGALMIESPRDHLKGRILIPLAVPGMFIKYVIIEEEILAT